MIRRLVLPFQTDENNTLDMGIKVILCAGYSRFWNTRAGGWLSMAQARTSSIPHSSAVPAVDEPAAAKAVSKPDSTFSDQ